MKSPRRTFATRRMLLIVPVAAALAGVAIAVPTSMASTDPVADPAEESRAPRVEPPAAPSNGCHVTYESTNWPGQFTAEIALTNTGTTPIDGWELTFTFPGDQAISSAWNATFTQTGRSVSAANDGYYDAAIQPGASRSLGFMGTWQSDDTVPTDFRVNGTACN